VQPEGHDLAELNLGVLKYDWDDPRVQGFLDGLDLVTGVAQPRAGFVWMMPEEDMDTAQNDPTGAMGGTPLSASTLRVWERVAVLEHFVRNAVHKQFYDPKGEWYNAGVDQRFAMWWVPQGHQPTLEEALARLEHLRDNGDSEHAFGWSYLKQATLWRSHGCTQVVAE
jgi:hypothetical protein